MYTIQIVGGERMDSASGQCTFAHRVHYARVFGQNITTIDHPPYSSDLALCDFYLFPKVKNIMQGEHFVAVNTIKRETKLLKELTKKTGSIAFRNRRSFGPSVFY